MKLAERIGGLAADGGDLDTGKGANVFAMMRQSIEKILDAVMAAEHDRIEVGERIDGLIDVRPTLWLADLDRRLNQHRGPEITKRGWPWRRLDRRDA